MLMLNLNLDVFAQGKNRNLIYLIMLQLKISKTTIAKKSYMTNNKQYSKRLCCC